MNIIRLTRHQASEDQLLALRRLYGNVVIETVNETLPSDPAAAVARFDEIAALADVVEAVLPIGLLEAILTRSAFVRRGGEVIRAVMKRELDSNGNAVFTFVGYERVKSVKIETELLYSIE